jgi:hypothetical protein
MTNRPSFIHQFTIGQMAEQVLDAAVSWRVRGNIQQSGHVKTVASARMDASKRSGLRRIEDKLDGTDNVEWVG